MKGSQSRAAKKKPKLGQHFLADPAAAVRIVESLGDLLVSTVLEIGPGRGALTKLLARRARRVIAIEQDRVLAAQLRMHFSLAPNVEIIEGDILQIGNPNCRVRVSAPIPDFVNRWCKQGPGHHTALGIGNLSEEIEAFAERIGFEAVRI